MSGRRRVELACRWHNYRLPMISPFPFDEPLLGWLKWEEMNGDGND